MLLWTLYGRYFTAGGQCYYGLNGVCYSGQYMEDTSQQFDSGIAAWMECVSVNFIWMILHSRWRVVLQFERSVLQWTLYGRYCTAGGQWYCSLNELCYSEHYMEDISQHVDSSIGAWMGWVTVNIILKIWTMKTGQIGEMDILIFSLHCMISRWLNCTLYTFDSTKRPISKQTKLCIPLFNIRH